MEQEIINRVAESGLIQIELDHYLPESGIMGYDLAGNLFEGLILREKDFRAFIKEHDWEQYREKAVAIYCSADAIIPQWAYMLLASKFDAAGADYHFGDVKAVTEDLLIRNIRSMDTEGFQDKRILIKGCSLDNVSPAVYVEVTKKLQPVVKSLMFGEACSTVPVYKR